VPQTLVCGTLDFIVLRDTEAYKACDIFRAGQEARCEFPAPLSRRATKE
jgi:hypothetical protein